eukprot:TRINITY_DN28963_c0_g1_i2.p1 TRINITY_DN28963_c0_g1~~TRINITY_DN28963_c0_g1_i2.p1  ORF type:complete len:444 (+),score=66.40 TRINITY_DN28963_c0_g1_i2:71-1402(+)
MAGLRTSRSTSRTTVGGCGSLTSRACSTADHRRRRPASARCDRVVQAVHRLRCAPGSSTSPPTVRSTSSQTEALEAFRKAISETLEREVQAERPWWSDQPDAQELSESTGEDATKAGLAWVEATAGASAECCECDAQTALQSKAAALAAGRSDAGGNAFVEQACDSAKQDAVTLRRPQALSVNVVISSELECAVCLDMLCEPIRLPCGHAFCRSCIASALMRARRACPLCRAQLPSQFAARSAALDRSLEKQLKYMFPDSYRAKLEQTRELQMQQALKRPNPAKSRVRFGNRHELDVMPRSATQLKQRLHRWTLFVELEKIPDFLVASAHFKLRPHLKEDSEKRILPFELTRVSSRPFAVEITLTWKAELRRPPLVVVHMLSFDRPRSSGQSGDCLGDPSAGRPASRRSSSTAGSEVSASAADIGHGKRFAGRRSSTQSNSVA